MLSNLRETIATLNDWQTIVCCRGLVVLLDSQKARESDSGRPTDLAITDFNQWVRLGGRPVSAFVAALCERRLAVTAAAGRRLMQRCLQWGYRRQIQAACGLVFAPVDTLGTLSPITIVASLATVMLWHPDHPSLAALLLAEGESLPGSPSRPGRHYPWFSNLSTSEAIHALSETTGKDC